MKYNDLNLELTHLWVDGFGWENTIYVPSDFIEILKLPRQLYKCSIFYCFNYNADKTKIIARKFKGIIKHKKSAFDEMMQNGIKNEFNDLISNK